MAGLRGRRSQNVLGPLPPTPTLADFARDPVGFIDRFLLYNEKRQPWRLSPHQRRLLALIFVWIPLVGCAAPECLAGCVGHLVLRLLLWGEMKKSGKTFVAACLVLWWAFTRASTEIVLAANDLEQVQGRIFKTCVALLKHNPTLGRSVRITSTEIRVSNGTVVAAIASDYKGAAGSRHSLYALDEPWGVMQERAERLVEELTPPPTEPDAWGLMVSTAGWTGESNLLEGIYRRGLGGERLDPDLEVFREGDLVMFWSHTPRQPWQTATYYEQQRRSLRPNTFIRLHENRWVTAEATFITDRLWNGCVDLEHRPLRSDKRIVVHVGGDAATKGDCTAVVAVARSDEDVVLAAHRIWTPTPEVPLDLECTIEQAIYELAHRFTIGSITLDPYQLATVAARLRRAGLPVTEYAQTTGNLTRMGSLVLDLLRSRRLVLYADPEMRTHALNTVAVDTVRGWRIAKSTAGRKIDSVIALGLACLGAMDSDDQVVITPEDEALMAQQERALMRRWGWLPEPPGGYQNLALDDNGWPIDRRYRPFFGDELMWLS